MVTIKILSVESKLTVEDKKKIFFQIFERNFFISR
jgi:hypothetical protein